jgi:hypothetical protein
VTDDESSVDPRAHANPDTYGETLLYDFSKFLTTLSLLILGAVLTLLKESARGQIKPVIVGLIIGSVSVAAILSISAASNLALSRWTAGTPSRFLQHYLKGSYFLLSFGTGVFIFIWWKTLR